MATAGKDSYQGAAVSGKQKLQRPIKIKNDRKDVAYRGAMVLCLCFEWEGEQPNRRRRIRADMNRMLFLFSESDFGFERLLWPNMITDSRKFLVVSFALTKSKFTTIVPSLAHPQTKLYYPLPPSPPFALSVLARLPAFRERREMQPNPTL